MKKLLLVGLALVLVGCESVTEVEITSDDIDEIEVISEDEVTESVVETASTTEVSDMFTERDLEQSYDEVDETIDLSTVEDYDLVISSEGTYLITGSAENLTITVDVDDEEKVQLVLDDVSIINEEMPAIYVISADKVFITLVGDNYIEMSGFAYADAAIYSKDDLTINGEGTLELVSDYNGIVSKDDLKVTGGTLLITSGEDGLEANDSIRIAGGDITIDSGLDALHSENDEEDLGYVYISDGTLDITAGDDAIRANTYIQIDGGTITINDSYEGVEATQVYINGGTIDLYSSDDGLNATNKTNLDVEIVITGGDITIEVGSGDTDGIDSNGDLTISGGLITITAPTSAVDVDGTVTHTGGTVIVNDEEVSDASEIVSAGGGQKNR